MNKTKHKSYFYFEISLQDRRSTDTSTYQWVESLQGWAWPVGWGSGHQSLGQEMWRWPPIPLPSPGATSAETNNI